MRLLCNLFAINLCLLSAHEYDWILTGFMGIHMRKRREFFRNILRSSDEDDVIDYYQYRRQ